MNLRRSSVKYQQLIFAFKQG